MIDEHWQVFQPFASGLLHGAESSLLLLLHLPAVSGCHSTKFLDWYILCTCIVLVSLMLNYCHINFITVL